MRHFPRRRIRQRRFDNRLMARSDVWNNKLGSALTDPLPVGFFCVTRIKASQPWQTMGYDDGFRMICAPYAPRLCARRFRNEPKTRQLAKAEQSAFPAYVWIVGERVAEDRGRRLPVGQPAQSLFESGGRADEKSRLSQRRPAQRGEAATKLTIFNNLRCAKKLSVSRTERYGESGELQSTAATLKPAKSRLLWAR